MRERNVSLLGYLHALSPCTRCQATPQQRVQADSCELIVNL